MVQVLLAIVIIGAAIWWLGRQRRLPGNRLQRQRGLGRSTATAVPESLMRRLDRLTRDRRVSERLIERIEFNHPGRSRRWCVEKAIYDLQRDRRS
ncbi:MAG: hypothetical protein AAGF98_19465 [Cyanobacteria bacterium P01_H01_bin.153]